MILQVYADTLLIWYGTQPALKIKIKHSENWEEALAKLTKDTLDMWPSKRKKQKKERFVVMHGHKKKYIYMH